MQKNIIIAASVVLGLAACSSTGALHSPKGDTNITGTVTRGAFEPHGIEVRLDGKTYRGEWRTGAPTPEQISATSFPHKKHVGRVKSTLSADDGSKLNCTWQSHGDTAEGSCSGDGRDYPLNLK